MTDVPLESDFDQLRAAAPADSPLAISAWLAFEISDRLITALRTLDRNSAEGVVYMLAQGLEDLAIRADPNLIETDALDASERQRVYTSLDKMDRRVLMRLDEDRPLPRGIDQMQDILSHLVRLGLITPFPAYAVTVRGRQIAEGVRKRWPKGEAS